MEAIKHDVTKQDALRNALYLSTPARAQAPSLEVCLAKTAAEVLEAQKLLKNMVQIWVVTGLIMMCLMPTVITFL